MSSAAIGSSLPSVNVRIGNEITRSRVVEARALTVSVPLLTIVFAPSVPDMPVAAAVASARALDVALPDREIVAPLARA